MMAVARLLVLQEQAALAVGLKQRRETAVFPAVAREAVAAVMLTQAQAVQEGRAS